MKVKIYCLYDPQECKIRYIGRTRKPIDHRLCEHISKARYFERYFPGKKLPHKVNWIKSVLNEGREPSIKYLTEIEGWKESHVFERALVNKYKDKYDLTNADDRGEGEVNKIVSEEDKQKISETLKRKYENGEIVSLSKKSIYLFNNKGLLIVKKDSHSEMADYLKVSCKCISKKLKIGRSINNFYLSSSEILDLNKYLYIFNILTGELRLFDRIEEVKDFLNISRCRYNTLLRNNESENNWIIKSTIYTDKRIKLEKDGITYVFNSVKEVSDFIPCHSSSVYYLLNNKRNSIFNYKIKNKNKI